LQKENPQDLSILRHGASHILAQAVKRFFPEAKLGIGPPIKDGFYYDFDIDGELLSQNLPRIEKEMRKIVKENFPFNKEKINKSKAEHIFKEREEPYKLELLKEIEDDIVTLYSQGDFVDLCRGPHLQSTGEVKFFTLLSVAGAYWKGKEGNPMLARVYGTAFFTQDAMKQHLNMLEEAKKRDHRRIGKDLHLFTISPQIGAGLPIYYPRGAMLKEILENFEKTEHLKRGYQLVWTPHIFRSHLWEESGHLDFYRENMYLFSIDKQEYVIKPMNCPGHILIYKSRIRSYRDIPLRFFELGTVYRREESGVLHGLLRLRGFTQDDAHIFCMPSQVVEEVRGVIRFTLFMMNVFKLGYRVTLSTRPAKYIGSLTSWNEATKALKDALKEENLNFEIAPGEGAFYGPKIDIQMEDALGRLWQGRTIQVDFNLPERFNLTYIAPDGEKKRVAMIHRVVLGTIERFLGVLIEHLGGNFPLWLSPIQVRILTVTEKEISFAQDIYQKMINEGIRVEVNIKNEMLGHKVREAELDRIPYMVILGKEEMNKKVLTVRERKGNNLKNITIENCLQMLKDKVKHRE